jgi:hypothetical protein
MGPPPINPLLCLLAVALEVRELREGHQGSSMGSGQAAFPMIPDRNVRMGLADD